MSKPRISVAFVDVKTRGQRKTHPSSVFLCYADATLRVNGADLLRIRNFSLRILNGAFRVDFPVELATDGKRYPVCFPNTKQSRVALTSAMRSAYAKHIGKVKVAA